MNQSWDNSGLPPEKKGMSTGAKVALGCGIAFVVVIGGCLALVGGGAYYGMKKGNEAMDKVWSEVQTDVHKLATEEGARALYAESPGLARKYPTADAFVEASAAWRPKLANFPAQRPDLKEIFKGKTGLHFQASKNNGVSTVTFRYPLTKGGSLVFQTEDDQLVDIGVE